MTQWVLLFCLLALRLRLSCEWCASLFLAYFEPTKKCANVLTWAKASPVKGSEESDGAIFLLTHTRSCGCGDLQLSKFEAHNHNHNHNHSNTMSTLPQSNGFKAEEPAHRPFSAISAVSHQRGAIKAEPDHRPFAARSRGRERRTRPPPPNVQPTPPPPPHPLSNTHSAFLDHAEFVFNSTPKFGAIKPGRIEYYPPNVSGHKIDGAMLSPVSIFLSQDGMQFPMPSRPSMRPPLNAANPTGPALCAQQRKNTDVDPWSRRLELVCDKDPHGSSQKYIRVVYRNSDSGMRILGDVDRHDVERVGSLIGKVKRARMKHAISHSHRDAKRQKPCQTLEPAVLP